MRRSIRKSMLAILLVVLLGACGQAAPQATSQGGEPATITTTAGISSHGGPLRDHASMIDHLRARGLTVEPIGEVQQPFLRAKGTTLRISGGEIKEPAEVQSYDYNDTDFGNGAAAAEEDAA